jgi:hypothetical protein
MRTPLLLAALVLLLPPVWRPASDSMWLPASAGTTWGPASAGPQHRYEVPATLEAIHRPFDELLDSNVRDGMVYYRALQSMRARLDRYVAALDVPEATYGRWTREQQMAYWVNAYNAFVLKTVVDRYPIRGKAADYPANSIRQIPGAFDRIQHRAAGRSVTLDQIEKEVLPAFAEPRLYLALGRGAVGSGRLRSEAYSGAVLERQLDAVAVDFLTHQQMIRIDRDADVISVTPILSWREAEFVKAYDPGASGPYAQRSPIERALIAFIAPRVLPLEKDLLQKNTFRVVFHDVDWRLNDLTGGRID